LKKKWREDKRAVGRPRIVALDDWMEGSE